jgi:serine/threonine protein kinase
MDRLGKDFRLAVAMPLMRNGSVMDQVRQRDLTLTETRRFIIAYGTALGMASLYSLGVLHRFLKPSHILLDDNLDPKVTGFGCPTIMPDLAPLEDSQRMRICHYLAPEMMMGEVHCGQPSAVYSFGLSLFVVLTGL